MSEPGLIESVYRAILRRNLLPAQSSVVVGVSGGTDSLALLHILLRLRDRLAIRLHVATLDHGLRGAAGADDARFVAEMAQAWDLPVTAGYTDVGMLAQEKQIGIEAAARLARYRFLASVAAQQGATHVAVAHNADDQVETVLFHLLRGSGLTGISGMTYLSPLPGRPDLSLIRPLLDIPRADLDAYCRENGLQPRHDASNDDVTYTRNRLRHQIIPVLRELSPQIERHLRQLADIAHLEDDFADSVLHQAVELHVVTRVEGRISLPRTIFMEMHPAIQRRFVSWAAHLLAEAKDLGYLHIDAAVDLARRAEVGARAQLTGGIQLRLDYETIVIESADTSISEAISDDFPLLTNGDMIPVTLPGLTPVNLKWSLETALAPFEAAEGRLAFAEGSSLHLCTRQPGDRFAPLGLGGHTQKISKWMIDHKVPIHLRDRVPLLVVDDQIAAIGWQGWTVSENFAVTPNSKRVIYIRFHKKFRSV